MRKSLIIILLLAIVASGMLFAQASAESTEKKYTLNFNHVLTAQDPYHEYFLKWAERVSERTNGNLTINVFSSGQLGVEEDILEQIRQGANVGQNTDAARLGMYVPGIAVMNGPYFVDNLEDIIRLNDLPTVQQWKKELEEKEGFKILSFFWCQGFRETITNKPIHTPSDLNGQRIRTPGSPIWQESVRAIGAEPVAMNYGDMFTGLQTKAIDGLELSFTATATGNFAEVCKYANETKHILLINFAVISKSWFDSLPAEYQKILEEECNNAGLEVSKKYLEEIDPANKQKLIDSGMILIPESEIDMDAFRKAGEAAYSKLGLLEVRDQIYKELGKTK
ncbi:MAG: C4-dicarboxylate TRAP transporter substrate-binding protein [Sphaerochaetaceae bacterium]|jgi:TRAP-type C4-dicarboxylate transport system substrate-binding protein|nr:C4-dicarboxylate TRAP transporter substrate-binding protein [Sphaerochaetaceae bacterium]